MLQNPMKSFSPSHFVSAPRAPGRSWPRSNRPGPPSAAGHSACPPWLAPTWESTTDGDQVELENAIENAMNMVFPMDFPWILSYLSDVSGGKWRFNGHFNGPSMVFLKSDFGNIRFSNLDCIPIASSAIPSCHVPLLLRATKVSGGSDCQVQRVPPCCTVYVVFLTVTGCRT